MNANYIFALIGVVLLSARCTTSSDSSTNNSSSSVVIIDSLAHESDLLPDIYDIMLPLGNEVVKTLDPLDVEKLFDMAHPEKGILFSPYLFINTETAIHLKKSEVQLSIKNNTIYNWGEYDGSGDPIELTVLQYFNRFVYDKPYKDAPLYDVNERIGQGNSLDNTIEIFPTSTFIEFHFEGFDPDLNGMDWRTIRLVFEQENNTYYLVAIIHDEWTI
jgi:hypothetical protein